MFLQLSIAFTNLNSINGKESQDAALLLHKPMQVKDTVAQYPSPPIRSLRQPTQQAELAKKQSRESEKKKRKKKRQKKEALVFSQLSSLNHPAQYLVTQAQYRCNHSTYYLKQVMLLWTSKKWNRICGTWIKAEELGALCILSGTSWHWMSPNWTSLAYDLDNPAHSTYTSTLWSRLRSREGGHMWVSLVISSNHSLTARMQYRLNCWVFYPVSPIAFENYVLN